MIIIIKEVKMNSFKINIIVNWLILINIKDVQSFLDFVNFYKRFIYDYSKITISLIYFIRKDVLFVWFQKCQIAFNIFKKIFTFKIILHYYNSDHKIVIEINALNYVMMIEFTKWIDEIYKNDMTMWYFKQTQNEYIFDRVNY